MNTNEICLEILDMNPEELSKIKMAIEANERFQQIFKICGECENNLKANHNDESAVIAHSEQCEKCNRVAKFDIVLALIAKHRQNNGFAPGFVHEYDLV